MNASRADWCLLIISLPSRSGTPRMRIWRALKATGAAVLRDGVYLLPDNETSRAVFSEQLREIENAGGTAYLVPFVSSADEARRYARLFDRTEQYAEILESIAGLKQELATISGSEARRRIAQVQRDLHALIAIDYMPTSAQEQAREALADIEATAIAAYSPNEPSATTGEIRRLRIAEYQGRVWATRARPWVDRLASAWFIRRFVDSQAKILWLQDPGKCPADALGFDFDNAAFTHIGARVTFEVLAASFGLANDRALARIGMLVHYLDVGGVPVAEAEGIEAVLTGMRQRHADDDALLADACRTFDALHAAYGSADNGTTNGEQTNGNQSPGRRART